MNVEQLIQILSEVDSQASVEVCCTGCCPVDDASSVRDVLVIQRSAGCDNGLVAADTPVVVLRYY